MPIRADKKKISFAVLLAAAALLPSAAAWKIYDRYRARAPVGLALNRKAWAASYAERGLPVPPGGPREGYWGARLGTKRTSAELGWIEPEIRLPGLVEVDGEGRQTVSLSTAPAADLLILGGSVAYGAYASAADKTYFARLAEILAARGLPVRITVFAAGAWTSANELTAFRLSLDREKPDAAVFLNGLNDLTRLKEFPPERRVADYLRRMDRARGLAREQGVRFAVALQPFFHEKAVKTPLEERLVKLSHDPKELAAWFPELREGLRRMEREGGMTLIDCSGALNGETKTTFSDQWHFSDPGHRLLAEALADGLEPVIRQAADTPPFRDDD